MRPLIDLRAGLTQGEGVGRYSRELVRGLVRLGVDVAHFAPTWARPGHSPEELGLDPSQGFARRLPSKPLCALLGAVGLGVESLVKGHADVVHHTQYRRLPSRLPQVATIHDLVFLDSDRFVAAVTAERMSAFARWAARGAEVIVTPSEAVACEVVERLQVDPAHVVAAPLGVEHVLEVSAEPGTLEALEAEVADLGPFLFTAARIETRKNLVGILRALERMGKDAPRWLVAGPAGEGAGAFLQELESSAVRSRVQLLGRISEGALRAHLERCAAFVLVPHDEGFGLAPLEAAALGRPVVTSDVPVVREVCEGAAALVDPGDPEAIEAAILEALAADSSKLQQSQERARSFSWRACAERHLEAYRLARSRRG